MSRTARGFAIAWFGLLGGLVAGCSSSSKTTPSGDAGPSGDATTDGGRADSAANDASADATTDTPAMPCDGLDAADMAIGFPLTCEECISASCCMQFQTCFADPDCKSVEICTGDCIEKQGMSPLTCATSCAAEAGSASAKTEADALNQCIVTTCPTPCNP